MMKFIAKATALGATLAAGLLLSGCPTQPTYFTTITPIYVATGGSGLYVYSGATSWTNYTIASTSSGLASNNLNTVVVSGSGSGAEVFVGSDVGVSGFNGTSWTSWTGGSNGLGASPVNRLLISSTIYAATGGGLSTYNLDGSSAVWTNSNTYAPVNDVFSTGSYTYIAAAAGLHVINGTGIESTIPPGSILATSASVQAVYVDSVLDIIAGTNLGVSILYAGSTTWSANLLPTTASVYQLFADNSGNFYAATSLGLYLLGSSASSTTRLLSTPVNCVTADGAGTIYVGTSTGLEELTNQGKTWTSLLITTSPVTAVTTTAPVYKF